MAIIAIDFDGTCVEHEYPVVGADIGAVPVLQALVKRGHQLVLFTMRSGKELEDAVEWFKLNEIPLFGVNVNPAQHEWTSSPKAYAHLYIDDAALGIPLIHPKQSHASTFGRRPFVDWVQVTILLSERGLL